MTMDTHTDDTNTHIPDSFDQDIMDNVCLLMATKIYTDPQLSLDSMAYRLGINRYYISSAINRCTGKNFRMFVNEYRIDEAIRILSSPSKQHLTMNDIAFETGFTDRKSLHRVFRKMRGCSPASYRDNVLTK